MLTSFYGWVINNNNNNNNMCFNRFSDGRRCEILSWFNPFLNPFLTRGEQDDTHGTGEL